MASGSSTIKVIRSEYIWTIKDFYFHDIDMITSPEFGDEGSLKWVISITWKSGNYYISLRNTSELFVKIKCSFLTIANNASKYVEDKERNTIRKVKVLELMFIPANNVFRSSEILLQGNDVVIHCIYSYADTIPFKVPECKLIENLKGLVLSDKFSDVTLVVGEHKFPAHKNILSIRSNVFAAMFEHDMEEKNQNRVIITDFEPEVVKEMLNFIYTGEVPNLNNMPGHLLAAADKYDLEKLKAMCEKELYIKLRINTALKTLLLADLHNAHQLKRLTEKYITSSNDFGQVTATEEWKNMKKTNTDLYYNLLEMFMLNKVCVLKKC